MITEEFKKLVADILEDNHVSHDEICEPEYEYDDWDLMVIVNDVFDTMKFVREISGYAWVKVEEDYDVWYVYLKEGSHIKEDSPI